MALVLVCSLSADATTECNKETADYVMLAPDSFTSPTTCYLHGQAYLAGSELGRILKPHDRIRVICFRRQGWAAAPSSSEAARALWLTLE